MCDKISAEQKRNIEALAQRIGCSDLCLLTAAVTHPTFFEGKEHSPEEDNQRLEFLGDAVLDLIISEYLFKRYPKDDEGELTVKRAAVVCEKSLAEKAHKLGLGDALLLGKGSDKSGDRDRDSVLADACEAVIGALYLSGGLSVAADFVIDRFGDMMENPKPESNKDPKSRLQEYVQGTHTGHKIEYKELLSSGLDHDRVFICGLFLDGTEIAKGEGKSKQKAETEAAKNALTNKEAWCHLLKS